MKTRANLVALMLTVLFTATNLTKAEQLLEGKTLNTIEEKNNLKSEVLSETLQIEDWMLDFNYLNDNYSEDYEEKSCTNENKDVSFNYEMELEEWMFDDNYFENIDSDREVIELEEWMFEVLK